MNGKVGPFAANECVLATIPGASDRDRLIVTLQPSSRKLTLRQQSWGEGVGWYNQSSVEIEPDQLAGLRCALGQGKMAPRRPVPRQGEHDEAFPRVLSIDVA